MNKPIYHIWQQELKWAAISTSKYLEIVQYAYLARINNY